MPPPSSALGPSIQNFGFHRGARGEGVGKTERFLCTHIASPSSPLSQFLTFPVASILLVPVAQDLLRILKS